MQNKLTDFVDKHLDFWLLFLISLTIGLAVGTTSDWITNSESSAKSIAHKATSNSARSLTSTTKAVPVSPLS